MINCIEGFWWTKKDEELTVRFSNKKDIHYEDILVGVVWIKIWLEQFQKEWDKLERANFYKSIQDNEMSMYILMIWISGDKVKSAINRTFLMFLIIEFN